MNSHHNDLGHDAPLQPMTVEHARTLISTGLVLGIVHVLAGPDHLSALATLSVGSSWRAISLGVRWGLGHSTGLVVVAFIFIMLKGELDLHRIEQYCDTLVGGFMVCLGFLGVVGAFRQYRERKDKKEGTSAEESLEFGIGVSGSGANLQSMANRRAMSLKTQEGLGAATAATIGTGVGGGVAVVERSNVHHHHTHSIEEDLSFCPNVDMKDPITQRLVSFTIGILHGIAGPGGILGVLPAVEMTSLQSAFIYLGAFIFSSTLSMGLFAALYGEATKRLGSTAENVDLALTIFSAFLSIVVGCLWLVLSLFDKLDVYFH